MRLNKIMNVKIAFTLAEVLMVLLILVSLMAFIAPVFIKKTTGSVEPRHGYFECYVLNLTDNSFDCRTVYEDGTVDTTGGYFQSNPGPFLLVLVGPGGGGGTVTPGQAGEFKTFRVESFKHNYYERGSFASEDEHMLEGVEGEAGCAGGEYKNMNGACVESTYKTQTHIGTEYYAAGGAAGLDALPEKEHSYLEAQENHFAEFAAFMNMTAPANVDYSLVGRGGDVGQDGERGIIVVFF